MERVEALLGATEYCLVGHPNIEASRLALDVISHRLWTSIQSGKVRAESPFGSPGAGSRNTCNPGALSSNVSNLTPWLSGLFFSRSLYKAANSFCRCRHLISSHTSQRQDTCRVPGLLPSGSQGTASPSHVPPFTCR